MDHKNRILNWIEHTGNRLPEPTMLFVLASALVMLLSQLAAVLEWSVQSPALSTNTSSASQNIHAIGLLSADGLWWCLSNMVDNFINFPPLGLVLVGMLGIGIAERSGFIPALLRRGMTIVPSYILTPTMVFLGIMSSLALDAGYIVLPPLAAALYYAMGRHPLAGLAAVFAGVSAGFSANLLITAIDPLLSGLSQASAQLLDPDYQVAVTANWWFMIVSTIILTLLGWGVTAWLVEPRLGTTAVAVPDGTVDNAGDSTPALKLGIITAIAIVAVIVLLIFIPGAPLYGSGIRFERWIEAMVPLLFLFFLLPGITYGVAAGNIRNHRDLVRMFGDTIASLGPYIVLAFFAAQFIAFFNHSNLGLMLAISGGELLAQAELPPAWLMACFVLVVLASNLLLGSASAKYALFAPVFVPMFMLAGISPELTQAAYRVGDSVSNVITPLNPYFIIVLAFMRRYAPDAGLGTLVAMMLPYTLVFLCGWLVILLTWIVLGFDLGPAGSLVYHRP